MKAWLAFAAVCAVALVRALMASPPPSEPEADEALRGTAFRAIASEERPMRSDAANTFPTDLWSRDDDFHVREWTRVKEWSHQHRTRIDDVLAAVDEGLRHGWPPGPGGLVTTTPPCRPRAVY